MSDQSFVFVYCLYFESTDKIWMCGQVVYTYLIDFLRVYDVYVDLFMIMCVPLL
jgi:hypothetical protein